MENNLNQEKENDQQKLILEETVEILSNMNQEKVKSFAQLNEKFEYQTRQLKELEQEKIIQSELSQSEQKKTQKVKSLYLILIIVTVSASLGLSMNLYHDNNDLAKSSSALLNNYNSNYVIENLKGDTINTWVSWSIQSDRTLHVNIENTANLSQDKIDAIKDAILSTKTVTLDDSLLHKGPRGTSSTYYVGWEGAVQTAYGNPTKYYIPQNFDINYDANVPGDIVIILTDDVSPDGVSGFTKSIADGNQILKSKITIYGASQLSSEQLKTVIRHEFGHAMGLAHSTAPEDLMHSTIQTDYPYISGCDVDAVKALYNGAKTSQVVCGK